MKSSKAKPALVKGPGIQRFSQIFWQCVGFGARSCTEAKTSWCFSECWDCHLWG